MEVAWKEGVDSLIVPPVLAASSDLEEILSLL